ncbi:MAG: PqqD family protein [Thermodesulfobacteriota bacterium]|nr:PqqD family protein [Thermodesulfobacteriota bacterium]
MTVQIKMTDVYVPSPDVVARQIEDEFLLVPIAAGIGNMEEEIYSLNETGRAIWEKLAPGRSVADIVTLLQADYEAEEAAIAGDVQGILGALVEMKMVVSG